MAINKVIYNSEVLIDVTDCDITEADVAAGKKFIKKNGEKSVGTSTGGGGTSAVLGELNVSSNGTYEAGSAITLVPGGLYQYKSVIPKETLAELYATTEANGGVLFNVFNSAFSEEGPIMQVKIKKINEEYVLINESFSGFINAFYATGSAEISSNNNVFNLNAGWSFNTGSNIHPISTSVARLPQSLDGIPEKFTFLLESAFDTDNEVNVPVDETSTITIENLGSFYKVPSNIGPANKKLTLSSIGGFNEFSSSVSSENDLYAILESIMYRNVIISAPQTDIEGIKYFKVEPSFYIDDPTTGEIVKAAFVYIEDPSKVQVTAGNVEASCWYFSTVLYVDPTLTWSIVYEKDLVDGYNKVIVNVPAGGNLQNKIITENGTFTCDDGFDGLKQVTVDFALQDKTVTANGTYTCDEGYGGLGNVIVNFTDRGYIDSAKMAIHTMSGDDNLSLDKNNSTVEELIINNGVTSISNTHSKKYPNLKRVILPNTLTSIGEASFAQASSLTNILIPDSVLEINRYAFSSCSSLKSITIGKGVKLLGLDAFANCSSLTDMYYNGEIADWCGISGLNNVLKECKLYINNERLSGDIVIPEGVTKIESCAFRYQPLINSVVLPNGLLNIGSYVFSNCTALTSVNIQESLESIGAGAFANCILLNSINIPKNTTDIADHAFSGCSSLKNINVSSENPNYCDENGILFNKDKTKIIKYPCGKTDSSYTAPDSTTIVYGMAFEDSGFITNITLNNVTDIRYSAFDGCSSLVSVVIGSHIASIGDAAFKTGSTQNNLTIKILATTPPSIYQHTFYADSLNQIIVPAGCGEAYKTAAKWSDYADYIIEEGIHRVTLGEEVTCSVDGTSYSNQTFDVADQTVIHFEVGQPAEGGAATATPDGIFLNGVLVSDNSGPATYDLTVTGNVSVTYSAGDVIGDITYDHCYKIVMD